MGVLCYLLLITLPIFFCFHPLSLPVSQPFLSLCGLFHTLFPVIYSVFPSFSLALSVTYIAHIPTLITTSVRMSYSLSFLHNSYFQPLFPIYLVLRVVSFNIFFLNFHLIRNCSPFKTTSRIDQRIYDSHGHVRKKP